MKQNKLNSNKAVWYESEMHNSYIRLKKHFCQYFNGLIFFDDLNLDVQKRLIEEELNVTYGLSEKVIRIEIDEKIYGYDNDCSKCFIENMIHAESSNGCWLLVWDAVEHEFNTVMKD